MRTTLIAGAAAVAMAAGGLSGCGQASHTNTAARDHVAAASPTPSLATSSEGSEPTTAVVELPPKGAFATPADSSASVDLPTAESVFAALFPLRSRAIYEHDADTIRAIEVGVAREYDVARCEAGCPESRPQPASVPHTFSAPAQSGYPAFFVARATRTTSDSRAVSEILVFTRSSPADPWVIALDDAIDGVNPVLNDRSQDLGRPVPPSRPDATSLPAAMAAYWQHWWDDGTPPPDSPFVDNGLSERGSRIVTAHQSDAQYGQDQTRAYTADAEVFVVAALNGNALVCGAVRHTEHLTPSAGHEPMVQSTGRTEFGPDLAPGNYRAVDLEGLEEDCIIVGTDGTALAFYNTPLTTSVTGTH